MQHLNLDIETFSSVDIKKAGMHKYVQSPDFEILLLAYSLDGAPVQIVDLAQGERLPDEVVTALFDPCVTKHAYNAPFEWYCLSKFFWVDHTEDWLAQWRCTMLHGLYCGYTAGLGATAAALGLPEDKRKMSIGSALIRTFCVPCKPSKSNGNRTRTLPHHEPEKWQLFKNYCVQDVVTEMEIERRLAAFPVPEQEQRLWELDQRINARGVAVDLSLVKGAITISEIVTMDLMGEAVRISGLENPKSVSQLSKWLGDELGEEVTNLRKDTVTGMLDGLDDGAAKRMLEIRQELSKTSVKKYTAMSSAVCEDGRVRGLLQFYGANRTGRWAGRLVQVQNLPRNHLEALSHARDCVKERKLDVLRVVYGNVPDTLSQLIRTAFVPVPGHVFVVADFSAIEARVIAWLAGEQWRLDVFATHGKIYEASASQMFGVPLERIVKGNPEYELRQKGKVAELACIAEGEAVLTDRGLIPIEQVTRAHRLWDGLGWVTHDGVICKGVKEVLSYDGLSATPDHLVWVEGESRPLRFGDAAASGARLIQSGDGRHPVRVGRDHQFGEALETQLARPDGADSVCFVWKGSVDGLLQSRLWKISRVSAVLSASPGSPLVGPEVNGRKATVREPEQSGLSQFRGERYQVQIRIRNRSRDMDHPESRAARTISRNRSYQQRGPLRSGKPSMGYTSKPMRQSKNHGSERMESTRVAIREVNRCPETFQWDDPRTNHRGSTISRVRKTEELARNRRQTRVYDILNAGPRHRFTVSGKLVHNCGYQGGVGALKAMGADQMGLSDDQLLEIIQRWRSANKRIVDLWYSLENAALDVMRTGQPVGIRGLLLARESPHATGQDFLTITLPSSRKLFYPRPFLQTNDRNREALHYHGVNQQTRKWEVVPTYGGKLVENVTQAFARDCLAVSLVRLDALGWGTVFHVHDEAVVEIPTETADLESVIATMSSPIPWAPGLSLRADGFVTSFYRKD